MKDRSASSRRPGSSSGVDRGGSCHTFGRQVAQETSDLVEGLGLRVHHVVHRAVPAVDLDAAQLLLAHRPAERALHHRRPRHEHLRDAADHEREVRVRRRAPRPARPSVRAPPPPPAPRTSSPRPGPSRGCRARTCGPSARTSSRCPRPRCRPRAARWAGAARGPSARRRPAWRGSPRRPRRRAR